MISTDSPPVAKDGDGVIGVGGTGLSLGSGAFARLNGLIEK
jgi:hypothetical protein